MDGRKSKLLNTSKKRGKRWGYSQIAGGREINTAPPNNQKQGVKKNQERVGLKDVTKTRNRCLRF